nr:M48 family metalloprotease [uncultured Rhodoferax sp.]
MSLSAPAFAKQVAIVCIAVLAALPVLAQTSASGSAATTSALPNLGDGTDMTPNMERRLGDRIARELYRDPDYVDDAVLMEYVQGIWQPLLAAARQRGELPPEQDEAYAWEILLGRDRSVNAFALPGAYFGLHLGLVGIVTSRDELASVLAHELSHVTQRHISRMMTRQSQLAPWMLGAMILGVLAASKDPSAANAAIIGSQAAGAQAQLNFSRDMEREADRVGFAISTQAGFAQQGFVTMFGKLQQASRLNDSGNFPYLRSHPLSTERMADMQSRIELPDAAAPAPATARKNVQETDHAMMAARARVLSNYTVDALRTWAVEVDAAHLAKGTPAQQAASLYGATLAAIKLRDYKDAQTQWSRLSDSVRNDPVASRLARLLGAEFRLAQGDGAAALALLQTGAKSQGKSSRAELFMTAQAQLQLSVVGTTVANAPSQGPASSLATTTQQLQTWVADNPRDAQAWQLLSSTYAAQGRTLSAIRAQAEVNVAQLDYPAALSRFKTAQEWARKGGAGTDHFEASIVDTRTRQLESTIREQTLER